MHRRKILKKIGYGSAAIVVSPQIINMLHSCKSSVNKYSQFCFVEKVRRFSNRVFHKRYVMNANTC